MWHLEMQREVLHQLKSEAQTNDCSHTTVLHSWSEDYPAGNCRI
jgi:hypothetical protein